MQETPFSNYGELTVFCLFVFLVRIRDKVALKFQSYQVNSGTVVGWLKQCLFPVLVKTNR